MIVLTVLLREVEGKEAFDFAQADKMTSKILL
jgi:hypothetical protein